MCLNSIQSDLLCLGCGLLKSKFAIAPLCGRFGLYFLGSICTLFWLTVPGFMCLARSCSQEFQPSYETNNFEPTQKTIALPPCTLKCKLKRLLDDKWDMTFLFLAVEENSLKFMVNFEYYTFKYFLRLGLLKSVLCVSAYCWKYRYCR